MSATRTGIEWTDSTWNPMTGCTKLSAGCDNCYASALAHGKLAAIYRRQLPVKDTPANRDNPFAPRFWDERLMEPFAWREPRRVFVNSMSDVFHAQFTQDQIARVFDVMNANPQHQFQVLTKRPERAVRLAAAGLIEFAEHVWIGTSLENQDVLHRIDTLRAIPAFIRFLSCEPLLGPLGAIDLSGIHWVIGGGESGSGYRRCDRSWAEELLDNCAAQGVPFFWKQWGGRTPKAGGRELRGQTWDEFPQELAVTH